MNIETNTQPNEHFLFSFAKRIGSEVKNGQVNIPPEYGNGYVLGFLFGTGLRMIVRRYKLKEDMLIKRQPENLPPSMILISFQNILHSGKEETSEASFMRTPLPSVTITTQGLEPQLLIPRHKNFNDINLAVQASYLKQLLDTPVENNVIKNIIENKQPLLFEQLVSVELQQIASDITNAQVAEPLQKFFYKLKAEELICYLLMELLKRQDNNLQAINTADIKALYAVKNKLVSNLAEAPSLNVLAKYSGMSESKLKRLFKQVFGSTMYDYFQTLRMKEAAYLLREKKLSVSETGYELGFSNLSHFTRVFEEHIGMKPKKYSAS